MCYWLTYILCPLKRTVLYRSVEKLTDDGVGKILTDFLVAVLSSLGVK